MQSRFWGYSFVRFLNDEYDQLLENLGFSRKTAEDMKELAFYAAIRRTK